MSHGHIGIMCAHTHANAYTHRCRHAYTQVHAGAPRHAGEHAYTCRQAGTRTQVRMHTREREHARGEKLKCSRERTHASTHGGGESRFGMQRAALGSTYNPHDTHYTHLFCVSHDIGSCAPLYMLCILYPSNASPVRSCFYAVF